MPPAQNPHQTDFFGMHSTLSELMWIPKFDNFVCWRTNSFRNGPHRKRWFLMKIRIRFQQLQGPFSEHTSLSMVKRPYLQLLGQLNFVQVQAQVTTQHSPSCGLRNAEFLWPTRIRLLHILTDSGDVFGRSSVSSSYGCWFIVYWSSGLKFIYHITNSPLDRTISATIFSVTATVKWAMRAERCPNRTGHFDWTILSLHLNVLLNAISVPLFGKTYLKFSLSILFFTL